MLEAFSQAASNMEAVRLRLLLLAVALSQAACINVEDFGAYWDKAGADRAQQFGPGMVEFLRAPHARLSCAPSR